MFIGVTQSGRQNEAPKKASTRTDVVAVSARAATKTATLAARDRAVPQAAGANPNSASAQRVQCGSDAHRSADATPTLVAVLVLVRVVAAVIP